MIAYVDTSLVVRLLIDEPGSARAWAIWDEAEAAVSSLLVYPEARAALARAHREGRISRAEVRSAGEELERRVEAIHLLTITEPLARRAGDLAELEGLRAFDAVHLASALAIGGRELVFASFDRDLAAAARRNGLAVAA